LDNEVKSTDVLDHCLHSASVAVLFADTYARVIVRLIVVELIFFSRDQWLQCLAQKAFEPETASVVRSEEVVEAVALLVAEELAVEVEFEAYYSGTVVVVGAVLASVAAVGQRTVAVGDIAVAVVVVAAAVVVAAVAVVVVVEVVACEALGP